MIYETGDVGKRNANGEIEFFGRKDCQVKIRGYRIELVEIENAIKQYSQSLRQVLVVAKEVNKEKMLVAYLVSSTAIDKSVLRGFLQKKLPQYMVPGFYVEMDTLPLTPNGKIDRKALPDVSGDDLIRKEFIAPRNKTEENVAAIWQKVLAIEKIGVNDNFFELGGDSLNAMKLINLMNKEFEVKITINDIIKNLLLEDQAALIDNIHIVSKSFKPVEAGEEIEKFSI